MVSISPALRPCDSSRLWSGDLYLFTCQEALQTCVWNGWLGGRDSSRSMVLYDCLSSASLIGIRSACASSMSVAIDCSTPVMCSAAIC